MNFHWLTLTPSQDAYVAEFYPAKNFGDNQFLYVSNYLTCNDVYRTLIQFDLCESCKSIPLTCKIKKAFIELKVYRNEVCGQIDLKLFRLLNNWSEYVVTWDNQPAAAAAPEAITPIMAGFFETVTFEITDLVRGWHDGTFANNGLIIKGDEEQNNLVGFFSKEYPNSDYWPRLKIIFDCPDSDKFVFAEKANIYNAACQEMDI
ncbi:MAG: DNRLRE domain-containing protein [Syntrophomonas sp.]